MVRRTIAHYKILEKLRPKNGRQKKIQTTKNKIQSGQMLMAEVLNCAMRAAETLRESQ